MAVSKQAALAAKHRAFAEAYISNGRNGTQAAIAAGYAEKGARVAAVRLLTNDNVVTIIDELTAKHAGAAGLSTEMVLEEARWLVKSNARRLFRPDGTLIPIHELPEDVAASIASFEVNDQGQPVKVKFWDKNAALDKAMRHLGMFEKDNSQKGENLKVQILLVGPRE